MAHHPKPAVEPLMLAPGTARPIPGALLSTDGKTPLLIAVDMRPSQSAPARHKITLAAKVPVGPKDAQSLAVVLLNEHRWEAN